MKRKEFEQLITPLVERSFKVTQDALALARLNSTSFDRVILVGGSTRIPLVRQRVEAFFGAKPMDKLNPDEVVAVGAAIQAAALVDAGRRREIPAPPALPGAAPKTMRGPGGSGDDTESTLAKEGVTQGVPTQKKGTFPPGQRPIPGKISQPPGKGGSQPPGKISQVPGKMSQPPGTRSAPPGAKQPSGPPPKQGADADDPSLASFPDLNVPSPFEWSQNAGTLTAQVDSKDLAKQAGGRPGVDRTMATMNTMNTMTADPRSVQTMNTVTADPRQQAPDPRRATGDINAGNFGAMEEPPSLVSMVSSQARAPDVSLPDDSPFGHASDLSLVSTTGITQTQTFDLPGQKGGPIPRSDDEKPFGAVSDDLSLVSRAETSSPSIPSIPSIQERTAQLGGMPDPTGGEPGKKPGAPAGPTSQRTVQMQGSPPPAPRIEPFGQLKPNAPIPRGEPSQPPKPPPPVPRGTQGIKQSDAPGQSPSQPPGFSGFGSNPPAAFTGFGSNPPPAAAAPGPPQPPPQQAPVFSGFQQGGALPQMPMGPGGPGGLPPMPGGMPGQMGGMPGQMGAPPGAATYNAPGYGGSSPFGGTTEPPFQGTELQQASSQLGGGAPVLVDVTPRALMIETAGGYCDTIIPRNSKIPCERTRKFSTSRDGQTVVRVRVAQGEAQKFMENTYLGEVELAGLRVAGRGDVTVAVSFELDADGTLKVRAWDTITLQEARATLQLVGIADESSVVMMINRFAQQPMAPPQ
jgi:molecular chaperone DnaK